MAGSFDLNMITLNVNGHIDINAGATLDCNNTDINLAGNWTKSGSYIFTSGTLTLNGSGAQNISAGSFNNLTINKTSGTATLTGNNVIAGNLSILAGTFDLSTYSANRQSVGGIFSMAAGVNLLVGGANNFPANYSTNTLNATSTVYYNGTVAQTVKAVTYGNLTCSNGGSNAKTQSANAAIAGDLLINSTATFHSGGFFTTLSGNWTNEGIFTSSTGTVILNGITKVITGNTTFNQLTVNGSYTVAGSNINYNSNLVISLGASYTAGNGIANVSGNLTNNGTLTSTGTTNFTGTSAQTIRLVNALLSSSTGIINFNGNIAPVLNSTSSPQFATLNINNSAGINPSVNWTVFVAMNVNSGAVFNGGLSSHTVFGSFTNNGTVTSTGTLNFTPSTAKIIALGSAGFSSSGTVNFGGTGQMTITGIPTALNNLIISNTHSAGVSAPSSWTVDSNFVVTQYATFNAGSNTYTIGGNLECDGVLNGGTSTFTMTSATAELSVSSETVFNNLTITSTGILTPQTDFRVAGNFTNNGAYDGSLAVLIMSGNTVGTITGTTTPSSIQQLTIEKTGGAVVSLNVNLSSVLFLNIFSGTLFTSTYSISQDPGGAVLIINSDATIKIGGTNTLPAFSGYGLDVNSNVDYAGVATTQTVANSVNYGNLIISGTGNKNAYTALTVMGNLTISNGTFNTNTFTVSHSVAGNFIMTGGTITGTAGTYVLNGSSDQSLTLLSNLFKLTINKASGYVNLGSNITVTNTLTFTSGKIQTGNYSVIIPSGSTVSGAALSTGWVKGNLQKNVATGTAVSRTFEIGGATNYLPATVLFGSVSTAGNLTGRVTETDHIESDYSGIDTTKSVNSFWSLTNAGIDFATASSTFNWIAADMDAGCNTTKFKTALYNGTSWTLTTMASPLTTSIVATGLTSFGDFEIGQRATDYKWTGNAFTADWDNAKNWSGGVPSSLFNTLIPTGITGGRLYPVLSTATGSVNSLTIESGATLTVTEATLQIAGSISNSGIFNSAMGAIELNGVTDQTIPAGLFENNTVKDLIINNNVDFAGTNIVTGTLSVSTGKTLTTNDKLVLKSTASGTARIASLPVDGSGVATAFITGNVTIERYIPMRKAWRLLSAPVKTFGAPSINAAWQEGLTTSSSNPNLYPGYGVFIQGGSVANGFDQGLTSTPSIEIYNNASNAFVGLPPIPGTNAAITSYPGYFLYISGDRSINLLAGNAAATTQATLRIKGAVNTGDYTSNVNAVNYTILGNPYPSAIDFETISRNNVKNAFYVWDPKLSGNLGLGAYVTFSWNSGTNTYDATTSASPLSQYIPSGEAIIIESDNGINPGTVTIKESDKSAHGSDLVFGRYSGPAQKIRVNLYSLNANSSTSLLDAVLTTYDDNNSNALNNEDAKKLNGASENIGIKRSASMLAIERRATIARNDTTYLNIYQMKIQDYQLEIIAENMDATNTMAVIKDRYSNTINNMPLNTNGTSIIRFKINSDPASYAINRFSIVFAPNVVLPVTFHTIKAYKQQKDIAVEWTTENEVNIKHYEVERSANGRIFEKIHTTSAIINNGISASYKFTDTNPLDGNNYYRIRSVEQDNLVAYSPIAKVAIEVVKKQPSVVVFPNPVTGNSISLQLYNMVKGNYTMRLFNASGQLVSIKNIQLNETSSKENFQVNEKFTAGKYELNLTGEGTQLNTPVIKR